MKIDMLDVKSLGSLIRQERKRQGLDAPTAEWRTAEGKPYLLVDRND